MNGFVATILYCSVAIFGGDCQLGNANDFFDVPPEFGCHYAQLYLVEQINVGKIREKTSDEYIKIQCIRTTIGKGNVG